MYPPIILEGEATNATQQGGLGGFLPIILTVAMVALFYFFILRPQKKQEKEKNNMINNLTVGDEVTTIGGVIGKVVSIKDETFVLETTKDKTKIRFLRSALRSVDVKAEDSKD